MGNHRKPGTEGLGPQPRTLEDGTSARTLMPSPSPTGSTRSGSSFSEGVFAALTRATDGSSLQKAVVATLGSQCFSAGVITGAGVDLITSVLDLLALAKTFVLADLHDLNAGKLSLSMLSSPMSATRFMLAKLAGAAYGESLRAAAAERDALLKELAEAVKDPKAFFERLADSVAESLKKDWRDYSAYMDAGTLEGQFRAGMIVGKLLIVIIGLVAGAVGAARAAGSIATKLPRLVTLAKKVGPRVKAFTTGGAAGASETSVPRAPKPPPSAAPRSAGSAAPAAAAKPKPPLNPERVDLYHGSKDVSKFPDGKLDPNYDGHFYSGTDPKVAQNAVNHHANFDQAPNPGMLKSSIPKSELDALIEAGEVEIRPYRGFDGSLNTQEYVFKTPNAKETFNRYLAK